MTSRRRLSRRFRDFVAECLARSRDMTPVDLDGQPLVQGLVTYRGAAVLAGFRVNDLLIDRIAHRLPARWPPSAFPWACDITASAPDVKSEVQAFMASRSIPTIVEVAGFDPHDPRARTSVPAAEPKAWKTIILSICGEQVEANAEHFPTAIAAARRIPNATSVCFTALEPQSHIEPHTGPNRGALRFQLPIIVPGPPDSCRIRVGTEVIAWREGEPVLFDLSVDHEVWNDSDDVRVLMMVEVPSPLPFPYSLVNRATQWTHRWFPPNHHLAERARRLAVDK